MTLFEMRKKINERPRTKNALVTDHKVSGQDDTSMISVLSNEIPRETSGKWILKER